MVAVSKVWRHSFGTVRLTSSALPRACSASPDTAPANELAGLLGEIEQKRARLEDRDGLLTLGRVVVDDGRDPIIGRDAQEIGRELLAGADVDRDDALQK
jgi:hypothetical protein